MRKGLVMALTGGGALLVGALLSSSRPSIRRTPKKGAPAPSGGGGKKSGGGVDRTQGSGTKADPWGDRGNPADPLFHKIKSTPMSPSEAATAIREGFRRNVGRLPTPNEVRLLAAQSDIETAKWGLLNPSKPHGFYNYNFAGLTKGSGAVPYYVARTREVGKDGKDYFIYQKFRHYDDPVLGVEAWLTMLRRNWPTAFALLDGGDATAYATALKKEGRIGAYYTETLPRYISALKARV